MNLCGVFWVVATIDLPKKNLFVAMVCVGEELRDANEAFSDEIRSQVLNASSSESPDYRVSPDGNQNLTEMTLCVEAFEDEIAVSPGVRLSERTSKRQ